MTNINNTISSSSATAVKAAKREIRHADQFAQKGRIDDAVLSMEAAIGFGADPYSCYLAQVRYFQSALRLPEAIGAAHKAILANPDRLDAREAMISLYMQSRDYRRAVDAGKALLRVSPRNVTARGAIGAAYMSLGEVESAHDVATELVRLEPDNIFHRFTRGILCEHRNDVRGAVTDYERIIELAPQSDAAEVAAFHLEVLDAHQMDTILILAQDDPEFRHRLFANPQEVLISRGFYLSGTGIHSLVHALHYAIETSETSMRPVLYH